MLSALEWFRFRLGKRVRTDELRSALQVALRSPVGERLILPYILEYCRVFEPAPQNGDQFMQGRAAGRRDVALHIAELLYLTPSELIALYTERGILKPPQGTTHV